VSTKIKYNTHFEDLVRRDKGNVSTKRKSQLSINILRFRCTVHIIHNCVKTAFDSVTVDIEVLVTKTLGYFQICI
jgi:hypothetical protein